MLDHAVTLHFLAVVKTVLEKFVKTFFKMSLKRVPTFCMPNGHSNPNVVKKGDIFVLFSYSLPIKTAFWCGKEGNVQNKFLFLSSSLWF